MALSIALAQVNPTVGDLEGNSALIKNFTKKAHELGATLVVFPEMVLTGYPIEDLSLRKSFQEASKSALLKLATDLKNQGLADIYLIVGYLDATGEKNTLGVPAGSPENAAAVIHNGQVIKKYVKHHLPNYGVFDEYRYFVPGEESCTIDIEGNKISLAICEDIWQDGGPITEISKQNTDLLIVINGSPFEHGKDDVRLELLQKRVKQINAPIAYVNMVGGQDDLVFDGDTIVVGKAGEVIARAPQFEEGLMIIDLDVAIASSDPDLVISNPPILKYQKIKAGVARRLGESEEIWEGLVLGLKDYVEKNNFKSVLIGLSGGIDSALVATLAADAIGADRVYGVAMPSKYSSEHSLIDAKQLAENIGLNYRIIEITPMVANLLENLRLDGLAEENLQARVRGITLMGLSNQEGHLVLATGNKSELAVGYSTLYGDAVGGFAPIKDLYKTQVWHLATWRNELAILQGQTPPIPVNSITKEPSAELAPNQKDSDSLPPYEVLDKILNIYIDQDGGRPKALSAGFNPELVDKVVRLVDRAEYKRRQYPPGTKISSRAFGKDRRLPITSHWNES